MSVVNKPKLLVGKPLTNKLDQVIRDIFKLLYGPNPQCFVCGSFNGWWHQKERPRGCQVGHYIGRDCTRLRWDLRNLFPQCSGCNIYHNTNPAPFTMAIINKIGVNRIEELNLIAKRAIGDKMSNTEKRQLLVELTGELEKLKNAASAPHEHVQLPVWQAVCHYGNVRTLCRTKSIYVRCQTTTSLNF